VSGGLAAALARLRGLSRFGVRLGLERIRRVLAELGDPQERFRALHIAGTNGKGSTAAMLEAVLSASGRRVGLYTSPHLCRFSERIRADGREIPPERLVAGVERVLAIEPALTFFEAATAIGFLHLAEEQVELAVIETGLGGRLDATNVLTRPLVTILTRIDLDHQEQLGHDLPAIAGEKAGILKPGVPALSAPAGADVIRVLEARARELEVPLRIVGRELGLVRSAHALRFVSDRGSLDGVELGLAGPHQEENAALVLGALEELAAAGEPVGPHAIRDGLRSARWPGRLEQLEGGALLLDGAHNVGGARALGLALRELGVERPTLIIGLLGPKAPAPFVAALRPQVGSVIAIRPRSERAIDPSAIAALAAPDATTAPDLTTALALARGRGARILIAGSLYLVGEARAHLLGEPEDPVATADPR
jgi:dihydrofolate synthase/folylpolyglutamate synthase